MSTHPGNAGDSFGRGMIGVSQEKLSVVSSLKLTEVGLQLMFILIIDYSADSFVDLINKSFGLK